MRTVALVVLTVALLATYVTWTASRMDGLHARTDTARSVLDAQLVRRAAAALELATQTADERLAASARAARRADPGDWPARTKAEEDLSALLRDVGARRPAALSVELTECCTRTVLARRFYNDAVRDTLAFRQRRVVRALRLVGHAAAPQVLTLDDTPPRSDIVGTTETLA